MIKKYLVLISLIIVTNVLNAQLRTKLLTGAAPNGSWTIVTAPLGNTVGVLLIGDNPIIDWTIQPSGIYGFRYRVCSTTPNCFNCCNNTVTYFYNLDLGDIYVSDKQVCCYDDKKVYELLDSFYFGLNAAYTFKVLPLDSVFNLNDETCLEFLCDIVGSVTIEITETPLKPNGFILDSVSAPIKTFSFNLEIIDNCCTDTLLIMCPSYITKPDSTIVLKPPIAGTYTWELNDTSTIVADSIVISGVQISDLGRYCYYVDAECVEKYCINIAYIYSLKSDVRLLPTSYVYFVIIVLLLVFIPQFLIKSSE